MRHNDEDYFDDELAEWYNGYKTRKAYKIPTSKTSTFVFKLSKLVGTLTNLLMSSLSPSAFKATKSF